MWELVRWAGRARRSRSPAAVPEAELAQKFALRSRLGRGSPLALRRTRDNEIVQL